MKKFLRNVCYELIFLIIIFILLYYVNPYSTNWLQAFSLNLMTNIISILLVVLLIDRVISINQENERIMRQKIAFQQLRLPLLHHFTLLFNIFKASVQVKPDKNYKNVSDLFDDMYFDQITFLDFSRPAPVTPPTDWFNYLAQNCLEFKENLNRTVEKYSFFLEPDVIDLIEEIVNSHFIAFILQAPRIPEWDRREGYNRRYEFFGGQGMIDLIKEYTELFVKLVEHYNQYALSDKKIIMTDDLWRNDVSPQIGSGRL